MKKIFLQMFAENEATAGAAAPVTDTAEKDNGNEKAAAVQKQGAKTTGDAEAQKPKYTDADVDAILDKKFAKWQADKEKAVTEAKKLADMNATQKAEYQRDQLQKELNELKRQAAITEMMKTSRKMLSDNGINISDELLSVMVTADAEETNAAINGFAKAFKEMLETAVKDRLKGEPPRRGTGGTAPLTKAQIMAIKDPAERQRLINENRNLFGY